MTDVKKRMRALRLELVDAGRQFGRAERDATIPPKQILLDLQHRLDHLRLAIWDIRKLCDPYLVPYRRDGSLPSTRTFAERIVTFVDAKKESA